MTKNFDSFATTLPLTEGDIYVATSAKAMTLLIQAVNPTDTTITCEAWVTDASNNHVACLFPSQAISAYGGISDTSKHIVKTGYKIRGNAGSASSVWIEVSVLEGM